MARLFNLEVMTNMNPETQMIVTALLTAFTSSGVMSLIIYLIQRKDRMREEERLKDSATSRMLLGLGHDKLIYLTDKYVKRGSISLKEKRNLQFLYEPYKELGGNSDCTIGYDACDKLPVVSDDEAFSLDIKFKRKEYGIEAQE